jgi:two-component system nitrogen regulation sensor histidine kinase NtrY
MILLVLLASVLIAMVTIFQYREEAQDYHRERLERKEANIRKHIDYELERTTFPLETDQVSLIFKDAIFDIKKIHGLEIFLYDLEGKLLKSSQARIVKDPSHQKMPFGVLDTLRSSPDKQYVVEFEENEQRYQSSYTYITDLSFKPLAILNLPYIEDDGFMNKELKENLTRLGITYFFMLLIAIALAYFLSKYITRSLNTVSQKITETRLNKRNKRIEIEGSTEEISNLVNAYNRMIDELESSAVQLAASEREAAWREMAKQVAHEIKNPLTPMRLTVQSFQRKFNAEDPQIVGKIDEYSNTLIQQIDIMSNIASAFSSYADMPAQKDETLDVVKITKLALDIFNESYIYFFAEDEEIISKLDRTQLIRIVTNLVKNSIHAISQIGPETPSIKVQVFKNDSSACITVQDNGSGISEENKDKVFEPKFTTKSSGMGLGLAMVKNIVETHKGEITFTSAENEGTTFTVCFPIQ